MEADLDLAGALLHPDLIVYRGRFEVDLEEAPADAPAVVAELGRETRRQGVVDLEQEVTDAHGEAMMPEVRRA